MFLPTISSQVFYPKMSSQVFYPKMTSQVFYRNILYPDIAPNAWFDRENWMIEFSNHNIHQNIPIATSILFSAHTVLYYQNTESISFLPTISLQVFCLKITSQVFYPKFFTWVKNIGVKDLWCYLGVKNLWWYGRQKTKLIPYYGNTLQYERKIWWKILWFNFLYGITDLVLCPKFTHIWCSKPKYVQLSTKVG